jgi:hypothetical protein
VCGRGGRTTNVKADDTHAKCTAITLKRAVERTFSLPRSDGMMPRSLRAMQNKITPRTEQCDNECQRKWEQAAAKTRDPSIANMAAAATIINLMADKLLNKS